MQNVTATAVNGRNLRLTVQDALHFFHIQGDLLRNLAAAAADRLVSEALQGCRIAISSDQLQAAANRFRVARGLHSADQTRDWMRRRGWNVATFEAAVKRELRLEAFLKNIPLSAIEASFGRHRVDYDRARLRQIVVASEGAAHELLARLREENASFSDLAREFSLDPVSRSKGGDLGFVERRDLPPAVAERLFSVTPPAFVGPFLSSNGVSLYHVEEIRAACLDAAVERSLRQQLANRWIERELRERRITFPLLETLQADLP